MSRPITNKEKLICQILVAKYDKDKLESLLEESVGNRGTSNEVKNIFRYLGVEINYSIEELAIQYLNYSYDNYENIKNKVFPPEIERVVYFDFNAEEKKTVWMTEKYHTTIPGLESRKESLLKDVYDSFWDYDFDSTSTEWDDWETNDLSIESTETREFKNNVIE